MDCYTNFASIYDVFMRQIPYTKWSNYIEKIFLKYKNKPNLILDLGCGTANVSNILFNKGYDIIGVDSSEQMLALAKNKCPKMMFICQNMVDLDLYGTVDCVISTCDCLNYILKSKDLLRVFELVNNYLNKDGLFIFDINTTYKFQQILSNNTFVDSTQDAFYIWQNTFFEKDKINEYHLNFFIKKSNNLYKKFEEKHFQKAYSIDQILDLLKKSGLKILDVYNSFTFDRHAQNSQRIHFIAQQQNK